MTTRPTQTRGSLYTRFVSGVLFPLHERIKGHDSVAVRRRLEVLRSPLLGVIYDLDPR